MNYLKKKPCARPGVILNDMLASWTSKKDLC